MKLDRHKLLEAIKSGAKLALELDDEDYNNEETVDFNKDKIRSQTNQEVFQERIQNAFDNKRFFPSVNDIIKQFNLTWKPKNKQDLQDGINAYCKYYNDWTSDLNFIDVSDITDMSLLFYNMPEFNGDISKWDVSNVTNMSGMFQGIFDYNNNEYIINKFNGDISKWDVSKVEQMQSMFAHSAFCGDISNWEINAYNIDYMFAYKYVFSQSINVDPLKMQVYNELIKSIVNHKQNNVLYESILSMFENWHARKYPLWVKQLKKLWLKLDNSEEAYPKFDATAPIDNDGEFNFIFLSMPHFNDYIQKNYKNISDHYNIIQDQNDANVIHIYNDDTAVTIKQMNRFQYEVKISTIYRYITFHGKYYLAYTDDDGLNTVYKTFYCGTVKECFEKLIEEPAFNKFWTNYNDLIN